MKTNVEIQAAEQNIKKLGRQEKDRLTFCALGNEHEILRLAKRLEQTLDIPAYELPGLKIQLQCRKEARVFYETLLQQ